LKKLWWHGPSLPATRCITQHFRDSGGGVDFSENSPAWRIISPPPLFFLGYSTASNRCEVDAMFIITQSFPEEKILFASNSRAEANSYFSLQIQHGQGWYELWEEGSDIPLQSDGDRFYAPYNPEKWDHGRQPLEKDRDHTGFFPAGSRDNLILTTWE